MLATNRQKMVGLIGLLIVLLAAMWMSIVCGYTDTSWRQAVAALIDNNGSNTHLVVATVRLPRALIAAAVGASLAMAGALMQALTRNPLASPGIFGINAGAGFLIVVMVTVFFHFFIANVVLGRIYGGGCRGGDRVCDQRRGERRADAAQNDACRHGGRGFICLADARNAGDE